MTDDRIIAIFNTVAPHPVWESEQFAVAFGRAVLAEAAPVAPAVPDRPDLRDAAVRACVVLDMTDTRPGTEQYAAEQDALHDLRVALDAPAVPDKPDLRAAAEQALEALTESIDLVCEDYRDNWRHGIPTRAAQLDGLRKGVEAHEAAISALTRALAAPVAPAVPAEPYLHVYEYDSPVFGVHRSFYPHRWNGLEPSRTVPLYTAPQPTPAAVPSAEPVAYKIYHPANPKCFYLSTELPSSTRSDTGETDEYFGGKAVPLYAAPQPTPAAEAAAVPSAEPVAWHIKHADGVRDLTFIMPRGNWDKVPGLTITPLYASPAAPQPAAVPLTDEQKTLEFTRPCYQSEDLFDWFDAGVRFAERHHGIGAAREQGNG